MSFFSIFGYVLKYTVAAFVLFMIAVHAWPKGEAQVVLAIIGGLLSLQWIDATNQHRGVDQIEKYFVGTIGLIYLLIAAFGLSTWLLLVALAVVLFASTRLGDQIRHVARSRDNAAAAIWWFSFFALLAGGAPILAALYWRNTIGYGVTLGQALGGVAVISFLIAGIKALRSNGMR